MMTRTMVSYLSIDAVAAAVVVVERERVIECAAD